MGSNLHSGRVHADNLGGPTGLFSSTIHGCPLTSPWNFCPSGELDCNYPCDAGAALQRASWTCRTPANPPVMQHVGSVKSLLHDCTTELCKRIDQASRVVMINAPNLYNPVWLAWDSQARLRANHERQDWPPRPHFHQTCGPERAKGCEDHFYPRPENVMARGNPLTSTPHNGGGFCEEARSCY